jgi:uncharacterized membrane protein YccC
MQLGTAGPLASGIAQRYSLIANTRQHHDVRRPDRSPTDVDVPVRASVNDIAARHGHRATLAMSMSR